MCVVCIPSLLFIYIHIHTHIYIEKEVTYSWEMYPTMQQNYQSTKVAKLPVLVGFSLFDVFFSSFILFPMFKLHIEQIQPNENRIR